SLGSSTASCSWPPPSAATSPRPTSPRSSASRTRSASRSATSCCSSAIALGCRSPRRCTSSASHPFGPPDVARATQSTPDLRAWLAAFVREQHFLARYPYYAHVLAGVEPVLDPSVPWLGISLHPASGRAARYYLHVNIAALTRAPQYLRGI